MIALLRRLFRREKRKELWELQVDFDRCFPKIGRCLVAICERSTTFDADQIEMIYQCYRLAVDLTTGVHFDDFDRPGRREDEDGVMGDLLLTQLAEVRARTRKDEDGD